jgi:hypothetical protein
VPQQNGFFELEKLRSIPPEGVFIHHENRQPSNFHIPPSLIFISLTRQVTVTDTLPLDEFSELARSEGKK